MESYLIQPIVFEHEEVLLPGDDIFIFQHPKGGSKKVKIHNYFQPT